MILVSGQLFTACEGGLNYSGSEHGSIVPEKLTETDFVQVFSFTVTARNWKEVSAFDRSIDIMIPEITDSVVKKGTVIFYLNELKKHVPLPFTYYQIRHMVCFQPSYEPGHAYINILGNFIININSSYTFKILVVNPKAMAIFKETDWNNYSQVMTHLKISE